MFAKSGRRFLLLAFSLFSLSSCDLAPETGGRINTLEILNERGDVLRAQFNRDADKVRLLFILDPACATCLRGLADLDRDLLASLPPNVAIYLVHLPVIGGSDSDIPGAAGLVHSSVARHYWNPSGSFGREMAEALPLRRGGQPAYAWDVWMIYGPDATWGERPPQPRLLMHQLPGIDPSPNVSPLDSEAFAGAVRSLIAQQTGTAAR